MSSTFFTASPHWRWLILAYFFLGGLAGGSYFLATLLDLFGRGRDRRLVHLGYLIAFPLVCVCGVVLTVDLGRPERFWHMLVQSEMFRPILKTYSPMSTGAWALLLFGGCAFLSFVAVIASLGRIAMVWLNGWGLLLAVMVLGGIALPLYMRFRSRGHRRAVGPALVLLGGLILRAVIIFSSDQLT